MTYTMFYRISYKDGRTESESRTFHANDLGDAEAQARAWLAMPGSAAETGNKLEHVGLGVL